MNTPSRREALAGLAALFVSTLPKPALAAERNQTRRQMDLPEFPTYENSQFGRKEHEAFHAQLEAEHRFSEEPGLTRWNSTPSQVYVNEKAGESIHITGVNVEEGYAEMIWVLAPAYTNEAGKKVMAHVPFEHEHGNQAEDFEKIQGEVTALVNGVLMEREETDFFTAEPQDDHIAWNPENKPLAMRVRYTPGFEQDGERALMVYWGFVNDPSRVKEQGQPANFPLLGALTGHLKPEALASNMPKILPKIASPFLINDFNRKKIAALYKELTNEDHPLA